MKSQMNKVLTISVVGCGRVTQHYKKIIDSGAVKNFKFVGFCDKDIEKAKYFSKHFGCKSYSNYKEMLEETSPELTLILTPSGLHYMHSKIALENGSHVLCEKPISMIPEHTEELIDFAKEKNLMYGAAFQNRLNPAIIALRNAILSERFGKIVTSTIRLRWCRFQEYYEDGWHGTWGQDGGVINQQAIHHVDAINWLLGPIDQVNAIISNRINKLEAEDTLVALLKFKNGALGTIEATTAARPEDFEASLSVVGEKGMVVIGGIALNKIETWNFINKESIDDNVSKLYSKDVENGYGDSHGPLLQTTIDKILEGDFDPVVPAIEALSNVGLVHALYRSDETKTWIKVDKKINSNRLGKSYEN